MNIYSIILAAGEGRRAGGNKLSKPIGGRPMLEWVLKSAVKARFAGVILVAGKEKDFCEKLGNMYGVTVLYNPDFKSGMSSSLKKGVSGLPAGCDGFAVMLGDMPFVKTETLNLLIREFEKWPYIVAPVFDGKRGHPPIISVEFRAKIMELSGDIGARNVIQNHIERVRLVDVEDEGVVKDIDTF
ncbi:nucleotidyltransferase family protein [Thermosediminibacter litoriperuensis]|uniref:Molybdenum cofactor cytidylyltransferase n=1 Tax=Thermosediminibacter litoriperuensis TaxID=291989 RepID=A0A5S5ALA4_9FIRM|nr:nucleotidyltransferase family protein [Thermosediminibacter litoriperuensis]TYP51592.1 molybdenum cofactor cytidylyltransferase [Thermosediminibacter litoriperuensis]